MTGTRVSVQRLVPAGRPALEGSPPRVRRRFRGARLEHDPTRLRRRGVGQILDGAMEVLVARFGACVGIAVLAWLPLQIGRKLLWDSGVADEAFLAWSFLEVVPQILTSSFVCSIVGGLVLGRHVALGEALANGMARFPGVVVITIVQVVVTFVLVCACVVPSILAYWVFSVTVPIYVLEGSGLLGLSDGRRTRGLVRIFRAMERSLRLVRGWPSLGRWLGWSAVANLTIVWPIALLVGLLDLPQVRDFLDRSLSVRGDVEYLIVLLRSSFIAIGTAYVAVNMTVYYLDQRVRREGLDLELGLRRLAARTARETA